jgi:hypothetical protein
MNFQGKTQNFIEAFLISFLIVTMMSLGLSAQVMAQNPVLVKVVNASDESIIVANQGDAVDIYIRLDNVEAYINPENPTIQAIQCMFTDVDSVLDIDYTIDSETGKNIPAVVAFGVTEGGDGLEAWPVYASFVDNIVGNPIYIGLAMNPVDPDFFDPSWYDDESLNPPLPWPKNDAGIYYLPASGKILKISAHVKDDATECNHSLVLSEIPDLVVLNEAENDAIPCEKVPGTLCIGEDTEPPIVVSHIPTDGATDVPVSTNITVVFSEAMHKGNTESAFSVKKQIDGTSVNGAKSWSASDTTLTFNPTNDLSFGTTYIVTITNSATDVAGNPLQGAPVEWSFTTTTGAMPVLGLTIATVCGAPNQSIDVPVNIRFLKEGLKIISLDITITYDADSGWTETAPSLGQIAGAAGWTITFKMSSGQDVITVNGANTVEDDGEIIVLHFTANENPEATDINITAATSTDSEYNDIPMEQFVIIPGKLGVGGVTLSITSGCIAVGKDTYGIGVDIIVPFPVNIENKNNIEVIAVDMTVSYDATIVTAKEPTLKGTLSETAGWSVTANLTQPGKVTLTVYGATPITDSGAIVNLNFVSNDYFKELRGKSTDLKMDKVIVSLNGGSEASCADTVGGIITAAGLYGDINNSGTHTGGDAAMVAQIVVGLLVPTSYQRKCADMNFSGYYPTGGDAAMISQKVVGLLTQLPPQSILDKATGEQLRDCYESPPASPIFTLPVTTPTRNAELQAKLQSETEPFVVQLNVDNLEDVLSSDIVLSYDESLVNFIDVSTTELTSDSMLVYNNVGGKVLVCLYGPRNLSGSGSILNFRFAPVQNASYNDLNNAIVLSSIMLNDGIPAVGVRDQAVSVKIIPTSYRLLQNYPNPFNPETWIPYDLPQTTDVVIKIYDISGKIIRRLDLGTKPAGRYLTKTEAVYWDGRNEQGESVASGVYYYQLQAGTYSAIKKLVVLK